MQRSKLRRKVEPGCHPPSGDILNYSPILDQPGLQKIEAGLFIGRSYNLIPQTILILQLIRLV